MIITSCVYALHNLLVSCCVCFIMLMYCFNISNTCENASLHLLLLNCSSVFWQQITQGSEELPFILVSLLQPCWEPFARPRNIQNCDIAFRYIARQETHTTRDASAMWRMLTFRWCSKHPGTLQKIGVSTEL